MLIKNKAIILFSLFLLISLSVVLLREGKAQDKKPIKKFISIDASSMHQDIDGFGVNITPAQWNNGNLKPTIDLLVDDLGATLFRFDCVGLANWLDPKMRNKDGKYPQEYLKKIYTNKIFSDAWNTFRYLNSKNIQPSFSISGRIPPELGQPQNPKRLKDYDGYAEMVVTMLKWARDNEHLKFSLLSPFNETDLGYPEGPKMEKEDILPAVHAVVEKLDEYGLSDVKLILIDDASAQAARIQPILDESDLKGRIAAFGTHTYGNGAEGEGLSWYRDESIHRKFAKAVENSQYKDVPCWLTEYGDLDQSNEIEYEFAWRSTRRLLKCLSDGFSAGQAWDAFDNFHEHDTAWAQYGLLKTDTLNWTYKPKPRYFAAKQIYRYVPKGFKLVDIVEPQNQKFDIYKEWHAPLKNMRLLAFVSPDKKEFTLVGMSNIEADVELNVDLKSLGLKPDTKVQYYRTSRNEHCKKINDLTVANGNLKLIIKEKSIFTVTSLQK